MTPDQEISKEFLLKSLDKIDHYWNFLVLGLVAFIGWLVTSDAKFTPLLRVTTMAGYVCFAGMNLVALWTTYCAAEALSKDFADSIEQMNVPGLKALAKSQFHLKHHRLAACLIHLLVGFPILMAIGLKDSGSQSPPQPPLHVIVTLLTNGPINTHPSPASAPAPSVNPP